MYSYQEFRDKTMAWLEERLLKKYPESSIWVEPVLKNNRSLLGIQCSLKQTKTGVFPTMYMEHLYEAYQRNNDFEMTMENTYANLEEGLNNPFPFGSKIQHFKDAKDEIIFHFMHTEQNKELLEELPHREFLNLSIVYRWLISVEDGVSVSALVNHSIASGMGLKEEDLYELAYENTRRLMEPIVAPIEYINQKLIETGNVPSAEDIRRDAPSGNSVMYVISNERTEYGAINILYPDLLEPIAEKYGCDLYLIPSSRHEMMVVPATETTLETVHEMLCDVNKTIDIEDILSNDVYRFDARTQEISQLTNTDQTKLLDLELEQESDMGMEMG